jgi:hypothetical protein
MSKLTPLVGVLLRKTVTNRLAASLEFDYAFSSDKYGPFERKVLETSNNFSEGETSCESGVRVKERGYAVKALFIYKII